ncbi:VanZ family protein [Timonella sp. A28]|uniref:VanZ family protein n=1 Tax=Timonella sp. A28 TaxID=3442640 RepID=UPI003EB81E53
MTQYIRMFGPAALLLLIVVVIAYVIVVAVHATRSQTKQEFSQRVARSTIWSVGLAWLCFSILITLVPLRTDGESGVYLIPLATLTNMFTNITSTTFLQFFGNFLLLGWFGFLLYPLLAKQGKLITVLVAACAMSLTIEVLQAVLSLGRISATDDVILNVLGAGVGYVLAQKTWVPRLNPQECVEERHRPYV